MVLFLRVLWGPVVPELRGAWKDFHLAKTRFFDLPTEQCAQMANNKDFIQFWSGIRSDNTLPMSLRYYGAGIWLKTWGGGG